MKLINLLCPPVHYHTRVMMCDNEIYCITSHYMTHCIIKLMILLFSCVSYSQAAHMVWGIWGIVQARYSLLDFDYLE